MNQSTPAPHGEEPTREDREAAENLISRIRGYGVKLPNDGHQAIQAFMNHRLAAEARAAGEVSLHCFACGEKVPASCRCPRPDVNWAELRTLLTTPRDDAERQGEVLRARFWLVLQEPGKVPERKGPWQGGEEARVLREFMAARPTAYIHVLWIGDDGAPDVDHGPEVLQILDGRSMGTGRKHNQRTRAAHAAHHAALSASMEAGALCEHGHTDVMAPCNDCSAIEIDPTPSPSTPSRGREEVLEEALANCVSALCSVRKNYEDRRLGLWDDVSRFIKEGNATLKEQRHDR